LKINRLFKIFHFDKVLSEIEGHEGLCRFVYIFYDPLAEEDAWDPWTYCFWWDDETPWSCATDPFQSGGMKVTFLPYIDCIYDLRVSRAGRGFNEYR